MHLATYLGLLHAAEAALADALRRVGGAHTGEPDVAHMCDVLAGRCDDHVRALGPVVRRYAEERADEPERLAAAEFAGTRTGGVGLLRDLQDLHTLASFVDTTWTVVGQAARGLRDRGLIDVVEACGRDTRRQLVWLTTRIAQAAPQALIAAR
jgi:hypothetical protein